MAYLTQLWKDLLSNISWARTGLALDITDPWKRREMEEQLQARGIRYIETWCPQDGHYVFAILGGGKKTILAFVRWFKDNMGDWHYYVGRHEIFRTKIVYLTV